MFVCSCTWRMIYTGHRAEYEAHQRLDDDLLRSEVRRIRNDCRIAYCVHQMPKDDRFAYGGHRILDDCRVRYDVRQRLNDYCIRFDVETDT